MEDTNTRPVYTLCFNIDTGMFLEIMEDFEFHPSHGSGYNNSNPMVTIPKGSLLRVDNLTQYFSMNFSYLKKYNKLNEDQASFGRCSESFHSLTGMKYRFVENIDAYLLKKGRSKKIKAILD